MTGDSQYLQRVRNKAKEEIEQEDFREAVDRYKVKLRKAKWWHKLLPFKILIVKRTNDV